ncbi:MAG: hypothetical protein IKA46_01870 [Clostridia bacterium]|nr:hypothetical protein [Clostridia bacterium]
MKGFLRSVSALLLIVFFASFCLWRYEKLSLIDDVTSYFGGALDRFDRLLALAEPKGEEEQEPPSGPVDSGGNYTDYNPSANVDADLVEALREGISNIDAVIDLSALSPTKEAVRTAMSAIVYSSPEYFYLQPSYKMTSSSEELVLSITPTYTATKDEVLDMREVYLQKLAEIVAGAPENGTDFDKILYLHDYFVQNYSYDETLTIRDAYTFFTTKKGVCQAYMLGLIAAARELGIESIPVTSDKMKHAWNLVKIDGAWYHVDITWDDSKSYPTLTSYTYFLQSDAGLVAIDATREEADRHREWVTAQAATDTKYDTAVFRKTNTPILNHNGVYYMTVRAEDTVSSRGAILSGTDITAMTHFLDVKGGYWAAGQGSYYTDCFTGLWLDGQYLYYNSGNSISRVNLSAPATDYRVYLATDLAVGESIYGIIGIENGRLTYLKAATLYAKTYTVGTLDAVQ